MREFVAGIQKIAMEENGGHPMIYGTDSAHGNALVTDAVFFGQQINGAATFNPDLLYEQGRITARDTLAAGIPWIFDPVLDIMHNPLWPVCTRRSSFNESAACTKHWIAYAWNPIGHDKDGVTMSDFDLLNTYFPSFKAAVDAGLLTEHEAVEDSVAYRQFEGLMVTDYGEINALQNFHRTARTENEATKFSLERTSIDMSMVASDFSFTNGTNKLLDEESEILDRLKESVRRVIKLKLKLGLYDNPMLGEEYVDMVGNDDDVAAALDGARESIVLLQNNDILRRMRRCF
ncbi:hypothetical protein V7S43_000851 [Phytophthora oleae]|uniref:beta-glucosidase n=1 Tax=Phytophthora oleae TaxID=2107226 RepID=A0ABD3G6X2_9STRA